MSELRWNWVYYPYLDAPNKQAESALKAGYVKVVDKDEADKVIAEKDKELRHQKYKRCLGMALVWFERAENSTDWENELVSRKRFSKWMELAEKFKEANNG